jgi:hypothetical protein
MSKVIETWEAMDLCDITKKDLGGRGPGAQRKLSDYEVTKIRNKYWLLGSTQEALAVEFGVCRLTIGSVVNREASYDDDLVSK